MSRIQLLQDIDDDAYNIPAASNRQWLSYFEFRRFGLCTLNFNKLLRGIGSPGEFWRDGATSSGGTASGFRDEQVQFSREALEGDAGSAEGVAVNLHRSILSTFNRY